MCLWHACLLRAPDLILDLVATSPSTAYSQQAIVASTFVNEATTWTELYSNSAFVLPVPQLSARRASRAESDSQQRVGEGQRFYVLLHRYLLMFVRAPPYWLRLFQLFLVAIYVGEL